MSDDFEDGVFFVPLDSIVDVDLVASAIASALDVSIGGTTAPLDAVIEFLGDKKVLLLLDNFEQVVDAAPDVAAATARCARTSRSWSRPGSCCKRLRRTRSARAAARPAAGRRRATLTAAEAQPYEAVELFVERARAVQPSFVLTDETAPLVVDICRRLDGLPLAIELAAARTRTLPVAAIHARLDQHLTLLTGGSRDLPGRQQTLRGAIDWSYELLEPPDRRLFERFSIHSGGAFLTQADAVCGPAAELGEDVLDGLSSLSDKSLVKPDLPRGRGPAFRDARHDPRLRPRATGRVGGVRHAGAAPRHGLPGIRRGAWHLACTGPNARDVSDRFELDHDNIRAALDWAVVQGEAEIAMRLIIATWRFWQRRGHLDEARRRVDAVLALPGVVRSGRRAAGAGFRGGRRHHVLAGGCARDVRVLQQALEAAQQSGDKNLIARALYNHGFGAIDVDRPSDDSYTRRNSVLGGSPGAVHGDTMTQRGWLIPHGALRRPRGP